jgi:hypothetical protein
MEPEARVDRRALLAQAAAFSAAGALAAAQAEAAPAAPLPEPTEQQIRDYLRPLLLTREDVDLWLARRAFPFAKYDSELGYLHTDRDFPEGQDGAICRYRYDKHDARRMVAHAGEPCRINTYGNSYTSCEQVSDGETWQETLAAHLGEPLRNYGIGAYSVYQAYLRMVREEQKTPARYMLFNVFHDDHIRNLHGWQRFKFGVNRKSPSPTVPHLTVDLARQTIAERPNPCPTEKSVYDLCDLDRTFALFRDDLYLRNRLLRAARKEKGEALPATDYEDASLLKPGMFASMRILDRVQQFARKNGKQVLYVLSYSARALAQAIQTKVRLDQPFIDYLDQQKLPYVDLLSAHAADAARLQGTPEEALARYFVGKSGHYNPLGNHFCAFALKDAVVRLLEPKPPAYRR